MLHDITRSFIGYITRIWRSNLYCQNLRNYTCLLIIAAFFNIVLGIWFANRRGHSCYS